jgi:zinc D-Ala-D-Ala carboxypeptidase
MTYLSPHFSVEELTASQLAARFAIDNTPPPEVVERLRHTALGLEAVRIRLGAPIIVSSGYRCIELNRRLGSKDTSAHVQGHAVDFTCPGFGPPITVVSALENAGILYDQLIVEFGRWVHISFAPELRGQVLQIDGSGVRAFA